MRWPRRTTVVAVLLVPGAAAASGCSLVDEPDAAAWDQQADKALADAASEVSTARLALETAAQERVWASYTTVLVAQAEKAVETVVDSLAKVQVPPGREQRSEEVSTLLDDAVTAVEEARSLVVEGTYDDPGTARDLERLADDLERAAGGG